MHMRGTVTGAVVHLLPGPVHGLRGVESVAEQTVVHAWVPWAWLFACVG